jgi:hypothetical protein
MPGTVTPPVTADEAIAMLDAALRYLDEIDFTKLPLEEQAKVLLTFGELEPLTAAARATIGQAAAARPAGGRHRVSAPPGPPQR